MNERVLSRLEHITDAIDHINALLKDRTYEDLQKDRILSAALRDFWRL